MAHRLWLSMLCGALAVALPTAALAQMSPGQGAPSSSSSDDDDDDVGQERDAASDQRTMHILFHGRGGASFPAGSLASGIGTGEIAGVGVGFGGGVGLGLSRYLVLELNAGYALLSGAGGCDGCSGRTFDIGLGLSYHLAQGIAFDPWISYGLGFRTASFTDAVPRTFAEDKAFSLQGLDFARLALGGDFYPVPAFGFGPYFEVDLGTTTKRLDPALATSVYAFFQVGFRIALDPVSKVPARAGSSASTAPRRPRPTAPTVGTRLPGLIF